MDTDVYIRLKVPEDARRVTAIIKNIGIGYPEYKSRVEFAVVEQIVDKYGNEYKEAVEFANGTVSTIYHVGEMIYSNDFDNDVNKEYADGINVYMYKDECNI